MEAVQKAVVSELLNDIINYLEMDFATYVDLIETLVNTANVAKTKTSGEQLVHPNSCCHT